MSSTRGSAKCGRACLPLGLGWAGLTMVDDMNTAVERLCHPEDFHRLTLRYARPLIVAGRS